MNIILIVVDSLRSDHLAVNGYNRNTSPNIDKLTSEGILFTNSICTIPRTSPSVSSILTGLYPHSHGLRFLFTHKLNSNVTTLQEILQAHGYTTIGNDIEMNDTGIEKGFDAFNLLRWRIINKIKRNIKKTVDWSYKVDPAETLTDIGIKYIDKLKDKKFFLYLHYIGLHWPYTPPKPYSEMFDPDYNGNHIFNETSDEISRGDLIFNNTLSKKEIEHAIAHYDGSIRHVDFQLGRLLAHLDSLNLTDNTLIILTADHGEGFGEHNLYFQHGEYLYDEGIRVPLILKHPKLPKKKIEKQVQSTDIMPTVLEILKIPLIDKIGGLSLMPMIEEDKVLRAYTFAESGKNFFKQNKRSYFEGIKGKWRMIRTDEWKLIYIPHPEKDIYELYNLKEDPGEKSNLIDKEEKTADKLKKELFEWMKESKEDEGTDLTEKSKILLRKMGYM
jgi:arylsulfatase A-like enzyme